jgi:hypothetical protein
MSNGLSDVLRVIQRDLLHLKRTVDLTQGGFDRLKLAVVGAGLVTGGAAMLGLLYKMQDAGREFVHQQALMAAAGMDHLEIAQATAQAWKTVGEVTASNAADNLKSIRELRMVFGSTEEALQNLSVVTSAQVVMNSLRGRGAGDQVFDMAKALEIKGASMDPQHFNALLNDMVKAAVASGGRVLGSDFLSAFKFGRTATQGWSDDFVKSILPTLIQEMKGAGGFSGALGPGNALQSAFQAIVGGVMSNKAAEEFAHLGLLKSGAVIRTTTGSIKGIRPGGIQGSKEFQANPYQWVQDVLVPALDKRGITDPDKVREEVSHLFVNRTAQQIVTLFATQQQRFEKDAALIDKAEGVDALPDLAKHDPTTIIMAFTQAWNNLMTALGAPMVQPVNEMIIALTGVLNKLTGWAVANPEAVLLIEKVAAAVAAFAVALGTAALLSALVALAGPAGILFALAAAAAVAATDLGKLENAVQNLLPSWLRSSKDANGKTPLDNIRENGLQMPWWMPLPAWPNGRQQGPDMSRISGAPVGWTASHPGETWGGGSATGSANDPVHVIVQNGDQIGDHAGAAAAGGTLTRLTNDASAPKSGTTNPSLRVGPLMPGIPSTYFSP